MKSKEQNESCKNDSQPPKKAIEVPQTNDCQESEIVEPNGSRTIDSQPPKNATEEPQMVEKQPPKASLESNFKALTIDKWVYLKKIFF